MSRGTPDYDQALKRLLLRAHDAFLALIAPGVTFRGELSPELPAVGRQADLVWEVERPDGGRGVLHVELQTKPDVEIGERLAEYAIRLWRRDHLPVYSIVVYLRPSEHLPQSPFVVDWLGSERLRYAYDVIRLWELPPDQVLVTQNYDLYPLAGLMVGATVESVVEISQRISTAPLPRSERSELAGLLATLAGVRLSRADLESGLGRIDMIRDLLEESSFKEVLQQWALESAVRDSLVLVLEGRFGAVADDVRDALKHRNLDELHEIARHAGTDTLDELRARLGLT
jgi:predicted transposase YdaD